MPRIVLTTRGAAKLVLALSMLAACGGDGSVTGPDEFGAHTIGTLTVASGTSQVTNAGQAVAIAPVVHVTSERGRPLRGATITLAAENGRGALDATSAVSNDAGDATLPRWVAPLSAGEFAVAISAPGASGAQLTARITATVGATPVSVATQTIGTAGGTLTVTTPGSPLNGFTIIVPAAAVPAGTAFTVSTRPVPALPAGLTAASPIIDIDGPTSKSDSTMTVKIPALGGGAGILHAYIIASDNSLVPVSTTSSDAGSVTVKMRYFFVPSTGSVLRLGAITNETAASRTSLILARWLVPNAPSFASGFGITRDNVSFVNLGSFSAPGGFCAGSTFLSGSWFVRPNKGLTARAQFPGFLTSAETNNWQYTDQLNPAVRLASFLQQPFGVIERSINWFKPTYAQTGKAFWDNVLVQIGLYQQPVFIVILDATQTTGHAILAYSIDVAQERIYVSDPNFPENTQRYIQYHSNTGILDPYLSQANAAPGVPVTSYTWFAEATYLFSEEGELFNNAITLYLSNGLRTTYLPVFGRVKIKSNQVLTADDNTTTHALESRDRELRFVGLTFPAGVVRWVNVTPTGVANGAVATTALADTVRIPLVTGLNKIGLVFEQVTSAPTTRWVDAKLLLVTRAAPKIKFLVEPATAGINQSLGAVKIALVDEDGATVPEQRTISLTLVGGAAGAVLAGAATVTTGVDGTVSLPALSVDKAGTGYTLSASSNGLTAVSSASFNVTSGGAFTGRVFDAVTNNGLDGVTVVVRAADNTNTATATTAGGGNWTAPGVNAGTYAIFASKTGYVTTSLASQVMTLPGTTVEPIPMVPSNTPGGISGNIRNASTTNLITTAATVELRSGLNTTTGTTAGSITTSTGTFTFSNVPAGAYTITVHATGYTDGSRTGIVVGAGSTVTQQDVLMSASAGAARVVLTWGATPSDLDSHFTGPTAGSSARFWVYYSSRGNCAASPFVCLDVDDVTAFGPETITLSQITPGVYRYYVYDYTNKSNVASTQLGASGARVQFYVGNTLLQTFFVPGGVGNAWAVFEWNGTALTVLNTLYTVSGVPQPAIVATPGTMSASEDEVRQLVPRMLPKPPGQ